MGLTREGLDPDPIAQFGAWFEAAEADPAIGQANAMCLSTLGEDGYPQGRIVLLKGFDEDGFVFFTNLDSQKGRALRVHPRAALNFHWEPQGRQVRIDGDVAVVPPAEADAYFGTRPRGSQIGAWASEQSQPIADRATLLKRVAQTEERFGSEAIPRPPHWSGFRLYPRTIEFWQAGDFRLHDRFRYDRVDGKRFTVTRLSP